MNDQPLRAATRVIKLGGSLLDEPRSATCLEAWLRSQPPARTVVVVGGGRFVDALRDLDRLWGLGDETAHWLAVRAMSLTARLFAAMWTGSQLVSRLEDLAASGPFQERQCLVLDPWEYLQAAESSSDPPPLPHSWDVTSDSIAARLAKTLRAQELVLLKRALPPDDDVWSASQGGYVDRYFPRAAEGLSVRCVSLLDERCPQRQLSC